MKSKFPMFTQVKQDQSKFLFYYQQGRDRLNNGKRKKHKCENFCNRVYVQIFVQIGKLNRL